MTAVYGGSNQGTSLVMREGQVVLIDAAHSALHLVRPVKRGGRLASIKNLPLRWESLCGDKGVLVLYVECEMDTLPECADCARRSRIRVGTRAIAA